MVPAYRFSYICSEHFDACCCHYFDGKRLTAETPLLSSLEYAGTSICNLLKNTLVYNLQLGFFFSLSLSL